MTRQVLAHPHSGVVLSAEIEVLMFAQTPTSLLKYMLNANMPTAL